MMATIDPPIPKLGKVGAQPATDIVDALEEIVGEINGNLDDENLASRSFNQLPVAKPTVETSAVNMKLAALPGIPETLPGSQLVKQIEFADYTDPTKLKLLGFQYTYSKVEMFLSDRLVLTPTVQMAQVMVNPPGPGQILGTMVCTPTPVDEGPVNNVVRGLSPGGGNRVGFGWMLVPQNGLSFLSVSFAVSDAVNPASPALGYFHVHTVKTTMLDWEF